MKTTYEVDIIAIVIPVLQMRELRYGAIKLIVQTYTASKRWIWTQVWSDSGAYALSHVASLSTREARSS